MSSAMNPPNRSEPVRSAETTPDHDNQTSTRRPRATLEEQKERFGGMKFGACFFGWLTATGTAVILTALLSATGAAIGLGRGVDVADAAANPEGVGLVGGIVLLIVIFVAYVAGGYVAGRMARFNGAKQGLGVWLWALIIAVVVAVLGLIAGAQFDVLANLNGFPRLPVNEGDLTVAGIITALLLLGVSLLGAVLGGLAGMRFHRKVDKTGLGR